MRDRARIWPTLALVGQIWEQYPDLRLTQLLGWLADGLDPFYLEEDVLRDRIINILSAQ